MFINGFLTTPNRSRIGIKTYRVPGTGTYLSVRSDVAPLLIGFAAEYHQKVEPLVTGWCWSYLYRDIPGSGGMPSFHSAGIAIDLNAPRHPWGARGTYTTRQRNVINQLCKKYGLRSGMNYRTKKDEMHFEVILPVGQAIALARRLQAPAKPRPAPKPAPKGVLKYPGTPLRKGWMNSSNVRALQVQLSVNDYYNGKLDGDFGPILEAAVKKWQRMHKLTADGVVGPKSWGLIF